jgi:cytochrome c-type biogenesis protein CcmH
MIRTFIAIMSVTLLLASGTLKATTTLEGFKFADPAGEQHFKDLISELRCLVCQNQSLADSDAELAHDLRAEVYEMVQAGKSDSEVVDFLVERYGDFVLYKPPLKPSTYLLWFGPFVLMIIAVLLLLRSVRRQSKTPVSELSTEERQRLDKLLRDKTVEQEEKP